MGRHAGTAQAGFPQAVQWLGKQLDSQDMQRIRAPPSKDEDILQERELAEACLLCPGPSSGSLQGVDGAGLTHLGQW